MDEKTSATAPTSASPKPPGEKKDAAGAAALQGYYARARELGEQIEMLKGGSALITEVTVHTGGVATNLRLADHRALTGAVADALDKERGEIASKIKALGFEA